MKLTKTDILVVLAEARALVAGGGSLAKRVYSSGDCYCTTGAILKALDAHTGKSNRFDPAWDEVNALYLDANQIPLANGYDTSEDSYNTNSHKTVSIFDWNDAEGRTKGDVITGFDKALAYVAETL